mmetsp:Transcript_102354/g.325221  ORF Transcript_102354/g.325221 Transcript_102354/m.325221 type:complete len:239 (-) Transcript_102354:312-1028(-)
MTRRVLTRTPTHPAAPQPLRAPASTRAARARSPMPTAVRAPTPSPTLRKDSSPSRPRLPPGASAAAAWRAAPPGLPSAAAEAAAEARSLGSELTSEFPKESAVPRQAPCGICLGVRACFRHRSGRGRRCRRHCRRRRRRRGDHAADCGRREEEAGCQEEASAAFTSCHGQRRLQSGSGCHVRLTGGRLRRRSNVSWSCLRRTGCSAASSQRSRGAARWVLFGSQRSKRSLRNWQVTSS